MVSGFYTIPDAIRSKRIECKCATIDLGAIKERCCLYGTLIKLLQLCLLLATNIQHSSRMAVKY